MTLMRRIAPQKDNTVTGYKTSNIQGVPKKTKTIEITYC